MHLLTLSASQRSTLLSPDKVNEQLDKKSSDKSYKNSFNHMLNSFASKKLLNQGNKCSPLFSPLFHMLSSLSGKRVNSCQCTQNKILYSNYIKLALQLYVKQVYSLFSLIFNNPHYGSNAIK